MHTIEDLEKNIKSFNGSDLWYREKFVDTFIDNTYKFIIPELTKAAAESFESLQKNEKYKIYVIQNMSCIETSREKNNITYTEKAMRLIEQEKDYLWEVFFKDLCNMIESSINSRDNPSKCLQIEDIPF